MLVFPHEKKKMPAPAQVQDVMSAQLHHQVGSQIWLSEECLHHVVKMFNCSGHLMNNESYNKESVTNRDFAAWGLGQDIEHQGEL